MGYRSLRACVADLQKGGHLVCLEEPVDANLEVAEIHRRLFASGGPAVLFQQVKGCRFPMVSNLFGTMERTRFMFRDTLDSLTRLIRAKSNPGEIARHPIRNAGLLVTASHMRPKQVRRGSVLENTTTIDQLPQLISWPDDGGAFITLGAVCSEDLHKPGLMNSNVGMYRIQLSGGQYEVNEQIGLHYQLHRGIGVHHSQAVAAGKPFRVSIFIGGSPAMPVAAVMPLPEGMSELTFCGALAGHRIPMIRSEGSAPIYADADFCIVGTVDPELTLPEGPFGDHLGYYSLAHDFPVLRVEQVYHRKDAIWPFTVVGRPPQEDSMFGQLIHELTESVIPTVIPGVRAVQAVDEAGVHPLLLAIGSERYTPYQKLSAPQELITQANAILGQGQMSLAKYVLIVSGEDAPALNVNDTSAFLTHLLQRVDWTRDLHFHTNTTIDTLDYSGSGLNQGSKVVMAAVGPPRRELPKEIPTGLSLPEGFSNPRVCAPGILAVQGPPHRADASNKTGQSGHAGGLRNFCEQFTRAAPINQFPLVVLVDDSEFAARTESNFLWVTFTRSNPAPDIDGVDAFVDHKHWGCHGSLVIDARSKPHHAPPLIEDPSVTSRVDALAARGGPLSAHL